MGRNTGVIFKSFVDAARKLDPETRILAYEAYFDLVFEEIEYSGDNPVVDALLTLVRPSLDKANKKYKTAVENGSKGGAPKGNQNAKKEGGEQPKTTEKQPETTENNRKTTLEEEVEEEVEVEKEKNKKEKSVRHKHGEFKHVLLTDQEYAKLVEDYGEQRTSKAIKKVDEYCERSGKSYKNYNLVLRNWGFDAPPGNSAQGKAIRKLEEAWIHEL